MVILGIETSCDDTAVSLVRNGREVLGSLVASQIKLHQRFGGVVPEVASRKHLETILPALDTILNQAGVNRSDIDAIAVTQGPGLLGSLLIGLNTAKTLSYLWKKPLIVVDHLIAHIYSNFVDQSVQAKFPILILVVSGGHTDLVLMKNWDKFTSVGSTRDDAAGEAFDKAAKILGLGYPGGPAIAAAAAQFKIQNSKFKIVKLPRPMIKNGLDFSFSGLKTALLRAADKASQAALAHEFQEAVTDVLATKVERAIREYDPQAVMLAGGVAANRVLRNKIKKVARHFKLPYYFPKLKYCMDNAVMVALAAYFLRKANKARWYNVEVTTNSLLHKNG